MTLVGEGRRRSKQREPLAAYCTGLLLPGERKSVEPMAALKAEGVFCRRVDVDYASHSSHVDVVLPELALWLPDLQGR